MMGGGIERVLSIALVALTGRPSRRSAIPGATGCPRGGHRLSHEPGRTRCLAARAAWPPSLLRNAIRVDTPRVSTACAGLKTAQCDRFSHSCGLRDSPSVLPSRPCQPTFAGSLGLRSLVPIHRPLPYPCVCLHHWSAETRRETNRQTHRCSEQAGLSAAWCDSGAVMGGD